MRAPGSAFVRSLPPLVRARRVRVWGARGRRAAGAGPARRRERPLGAGRARDPEPPPARRGSRPSAALAPAELRRSAPRRGARLRDGRGEGATVSRPLVFPFTYGAVSRHLAEIF